MELLERLPDHVKGAFARHEIWPAAVKLFVNGDLSVDGHYRDVWVVITQEELAVMTGYFTGDRVKYFSGYKAAGKADKAKNKKTAEEVWTEESFVSYPMDQVEKFFVEHLVSGGMLIATVAGEEKAICCFTNSLAKKFGQFVKLAEKIREGKELTEEDFKDDQPSMYCPKCGMPFSDPDRRMCSRCLDRRSVFRRVLSYVPRYKLQIIMILACMFASSALNLVSPYLGGRVLFDKVLVKGSPNYGQVGTIVLLIMATNAAHILISIMYGRVNSSVAAEIIFDLKTEIFEAMQKLSLSFYNKRQTGSLMTRINQDANHLQYFFHDGLPYFIVNIVRIIGIAAIMFAMEWKLAILVIIPSPFIVYYLKNMFPKLWKLFNHRYRKSSTMNALINDSLKGIRVVKAFGKEDMEISRFNRANEGVFSVDYGLGTTLSTIFPFVRFMMGIGGLIVWGYGGWLVAGGDLTFGTLITFTGYIGMIYGPLEFMTQVVDWWSSCMNSAQRIFEIVDSVPEVTEDIKPVSMENMKGDICVKNVSFSYEPNKPVLHDISFEVKAGEMIGLVGHSGAGKSTIANLITRLYDVQEGSITIDGVNVKKIRIKDLKKQIGIVSQETFLFMGTIAENIAYARPDATREEIIAAAKAAHAHEFIMKLPDGYDTIIGAGNRDLSGGERQRISIARAILHNPKILILDEATASVDTETERHIQEALDKLIKGRTTISIAHRLSTLRSADKIVVLENGKIVELGTHNQLIVEKGAYYRLVQKQSEALKLKGVGE